MARVPSKAATRPFSEQPYGQATLEMLPEETGEKFTEALSSMEKDP